MTAAKELEEAKDLFLATTSHELRADHRGAGLRQYAGQPVGPARRRPAPRPTVRMSPVVRLAGKLVEQLLLGARAGADQLPVTNAPFDLGAVLRAAATAFQRSRTARSWPTSPRPVAASGDTMATGIIVGHAGRRAFKYSPDGTVVVRPGDRGLDRGDGGRRRGISIATGDHERIFAQPVLPGRDGRPAPVRRRGHRPVHRAPPGRGRHGEVTSRLAPRERDRTAAAAARAVLTIRADYLATITRRCDRLLPRYGGGARRRWLPGRRR